MIIVGLTGGIGGGKTTVAKMFKQLDIPVYFTDIEAKRIMNTSKIIKRKLIKKFGKKTYSDHKLNRAYLANLVFNNKSNLSYLESIIHPKVNQHFKRWVNKQSSVYIIQENAILFENGSNVYCDYIITVTAPKKTRIDRVFKRDAIAVKDIKARINNQWSDELKIENSNYSIINIDLDKTRKEVLKIHNLLLKLAKK